MRGVEGEAAQRDTSVGHLHPRTPGYETPLEKKKGKQDGERREEGGGGGLFGKAKQQQLWQAIIIIKAASIKGVNHCAAATFLRRW